MKIIITLILSCACAANLFSQTTESKLSQTELLKQFTGNWKCELGKDTFLLSENKPFGNGMISTSRIVTNGTALDSIIQLYGYDPKADKFILSELIKSSPHIEICSMWFTSKNKGKIIVTNLEKAPFNFEFEFKTPDTLVQTALRGDKAFREVTGTRIK